MTNHDYALSMMTCHDYFVNDLMERLYFVNDDMVRNEQNIEILFFISLSLSYLVYVYY